MEPSRAAQVTNDPARVELALIEDEFRSTECAWTDLVNTLSDGQVSWRPAAGSWSVVQHLAHLNLVDASYLPYLDAMLSRGRESGIVARGRSRHPRLGALLVRSAAPPVTLKVLTARAFAPPAVLDVDAVLRDFDRIQLALRQRIAAAEGLDLGRIRSRYELGIGLAKMCVLSLGQWFAMTAAHDRRHLWLAKRVLAHPHFPLL